MTLDPHYKTAEVVLYAGDCLDVLRQLPDSSVDSIVTDPPAGIAFMGKEWDGAKGGREQWSAWLADVMREAYRVAKPGAHALVWALPRTSHWTACGIEDAGWVIRDRVHHLFGCLTADVEVLTDTGWRHGIDVQVGERVAQWDHETGRISLAAVERTYRVPWDGPMRVLRNSDTDQVLTPNHRVYRQRAYVKPGYRRWWSPWEAVEAGTIGQGIPIRLPLAGEHDGPGIGGGDYAALLGWVWTEGGFDLSGTGVRIYQSSVNPTKCAEIAGLLDRLGPHKRYDRDRVYTRRNGQAHPHRESTWFFTGELARRVRADLPGKRPTYDLLWRMTAAEKRALLRAAMLGDGSGWGGRSQQFHQKHEDDLVWLQTLLALIGMSGKVAMRTNRPSGALYLRKRDTTELQQPHLSRVREEHYMGEVWCLQVPTGAFVARRNGRVFITGNSGFPKSLDVGKAIDRVAGAEREVVGQSVTLTPRSGKSSAGFAPLRSIRWGDEHFSWESAPEEARAYYTAQGATRGQITAPATDAARQWSGWGTALKPSAEDWWLARKPLSEGTVAANVLRWGTGAINVDGCRVGPNPGYSYNADRNGTTFHGEQGARTKQSADKRGSNVVESSQGRWPAHTLITHDARCGERCVAECPAAVLNVQSGERGRNGSVRDAGPRNNAVYGEDNAPRGDWTAYADEGGAARYFPQFRWSPGDDPAPWLYTAKAASAERPRAKRDGAGEGRVIEGTTKVCRVCGNKTIKPPNPEPACGHGDYHRVPTTRREEAVAHPTVKPLELMRWLVRLITPPGGVVLDCFAGSGTTGEAALREGMRAVLIEREADYLPLIVQRLTRQRDPVAYAQATGTEGEALW